MQFCDLHISCRRCSTSAHHPSKGCFDLHLLTLTDRLVAVVANRVPGLDPVRPLLLLLLSVTVVKHFPFIPAVTVCHDVDFSLFLFVCCRQDLHGKAPHDRTRRLYEIAGSICLCCCDQAPTGPSMSFARPIRTSRPAAFKTV